MSRAERVNLTETLSATGAGFTDADLSLLRELGDLKRIRSSGREGTIATRRFLAAWAALVAGVNPEEVMRRTVASAVVAARLGDLDLPKLMELGLTRPDAVAVLERAWAELARDVAQPLAGELRAALADGPLPMGPAPDFATAQADQPRAGVTCPGRPRLMLQPAESHAEHCLMVALYATLAAPRYGADPTAVFLAAMAHHLHNAPMPDSGFTGEVLLGHHLTGVIERARATGLAELVEPLRTRIAAALEPIARDDSAAARAFHAGDVIDRVLEIEQHLTVARITMHDVLVTYELAHDGPVKAFHDRVLGGVGLL